MCIHWTVPFTQNIFFPSLMHTRWLKAGGKNLSSSLIFLGWRQPEVNFSLGVLIGKWGPPRRPTVQENFGLVMDQIKVSLRTRMQARLYWPCMGALMSFRCTALYVSAISSIKWTLTLVRIYLLLLRKTIFAFSLALHLQASFPFRALIESPHLV